MSRTLLVANNRFFPSGGPERYLFNLLPELPGIGWDPVPFALKSRHNIETPYSNDFPAHPVDDDFVLYADRPLSLREKVRLTFRVAYDGRLRDHIRKLIRKSKSDMVYGLQIAHYLYPEVVLAAADCEVPSVLRMSDFQLICPAYSLFRDGEPCELCLKHLYQGIRHRCLKGSFAVSAARVYAMVIQRMLQVTDLVSSFICPSKFIAGKLAAAGLPEEKLVHIPTPVPRSLETTVPAALPDKGYALYVGGLYDYKGANVAVRAAIRHSFALVVAGSVDTPFGRSLVQEVETQKASNVTFAGFVHGEKLTTLYQGATCVVLPSLWYENSPNVVLEAMAHGRPVVASDLGSLPEDVIDGETGLCFPPGNEQGLADQVQVLLNDRGYADQLGKAARQRILSEHSMQRHLNELKALFGRLA